MKNSQPLWNHLIELRKRLIYSLWIFACSFVIAYYFSERLLGLLARPLTSLFAHQAGRRFIYTSLSEAFVTYLKVSLFGAFVLSSPFWAFQLWRFIAPALYEHEQRVYRWCTFLVPGLFLSGAAVAYYMVCPLAWQFFLSFESPKALSVPLQFEAKISEYLGITLKLMMMFGFTFQLPILLAVLVSLNCLTIDQLKQGRKYAFLLIAIFSAVVTPPDLISPIGLMLPVYGLYEGTILWLSWITKKRP